MVSTTTAIDMAIGPNGWDTYWGGSRLTLRHVIPVWMLRVVCDATRCLERTMSWQVSGCAAAAWTCYGWSTGYASPMRLYAHPCNCAGSRCPMTLICPAYPLFLVKSASREPFFAHPRAALIFTRSFVYRTLHHPTCHWTFARVDPLIYDAK